MQKKYHREVTELSNCPNCNGKLSPFYLKQNCPHCGANLMYYDFENRLQQDAENAARETESIQNFVNGVKKSAIGSVMAIIRLVSFLLPIVAMLLPIFHIDGENISPVTLIKVIIADAESVQWNTALVLCLVDFAAVIVCSLITLIVSLFSFTKNGLKRNVIVSALGIIIFAGLYLAVVTADATVSITYGFFLIPVLQMLTMALHFAVNNKINGQ